MYRYCVGRLKMSEDVARKRIQAARAARQFPAIFAAVADGRLHLTAVVKLAPHFTPESAAELLAAAANKTRGEIECLLAERFPRPDAPALVRPIESAGAVGACVFEQRVPEPVPSCERGVSRLRRDRE